VYTKATTKKMGRSKFNRKNSGPVNTSYQRTNSSNSNATTPGLIGSQSKAETLEAIDYHFDQAALTGLKPFLLNDPSSLNLKKFIDFWSSPENIQSTSPSVAASICGCSWYLAMVSLHEYLLPSFHTCFMYSHHDHYYYLSHLLPSRTI
jgi:hypothetical protein